MTERRDPEEDDGPGDSAFDEHVLPAELTALAMRGSAASRRVPGARELPDFAAHLHSREPLSTFFEELLEKLHHPAEERRWRLWADQAPNGRHPGLTGLAVSGGGVRSSTFNLGIVQVLHRLGLFACLDYLSTVSGGGYLGASISASYAGENTAGLTPAEKFERTERLFPYQHQSGRPEPSAFLQLRNYANFLAPRGLVDYLRVPVLMLRGLLVNVLVFLPWLLGLALATYAAMRESADGWRWFWYSGLLPGGFDLTGVLAAVLLVATVLFPVARRIRILWNGSGTSRDFRTHYERMLVVVFVGCLGAAWVEFQPLVIDYFLRSTAELGGLTAAVGGASAALALLGRAFARKLRSLIARYALYLVALAGFLAFWLFYVLSCVWLVQTGQWWLAAGALFPLAVYAACIDANGLSLHNFYRDCLARAFLFKARGHGQVDPTPDLKLTELSASLGPLHLFNTTMNTSHFPERFRKGRHGDPFFLSSIFTGSRATGYCPTAVLEQAQPDLTVSTAMATSGAAVTSNMGVQTRPALRAILSVLNVRLGYWLKNPHHYDFATRTLALPLGRLLGVGVARYLQELIGLMSYKRSYVYLSDGGHIENMGIYPLVRRNCRLIIVGDGEADPLCTFQGLLDALRMIRIDFGVNVRMDGLDDIRAGRTHHALGTINYPGGRHGYLIYLKSSLPGDYMLESTLTAERFVSSPLRQDAGAYDQLCYIAHYKALHTAFPHEPTADQFFDEVQFECYRALGFLVAESVLIGDAQMPAAEAGDEQEPAPELAVSA